MSISYTKALISGFACGALATAVFVQPGLSGRAIRVMGAGGVVGTACAIAPIALIAQVVNSIYKPEYDQKSLKEKKFTLIKAAAITIVSPLLGALSIAAIMNRMKLRVSNDAAAVIWCCSTFGLVSGAISSR